jgi:transposase
MALVELSKVEQRYRAVLEAASGVPVTEVAARYGVSRQSVHAWRHRYAEGGLGALADRPKRPDTCPHQVSADIEAVVCEMRREHPRWGPLRIVHELAKAGVSPVPSRMSAYRALVRHGLAEPGARRRRKDIYLRWEREAPMALWQLDIMGGAFLADGTEAKIVTGVDDHSRYCVICQVVVRATGRAVCLAFAAALAEFGVPEEVLTDNGKQFTDRFGKGGEVLFDRICRDNGIIHRLTQPRHRPPRARSKGSTAACAVSCSMTRSRSPAWPPRRPRSMPGGSSTTPPGRTRRSAWPARPTGLPAPRAARQSSCCRCGCPPSCPRCRRRAQARATRARVLPTWLGPGPCGAPHRGITGQASPPPITTSSFPAPRPRAKPGHRPNPGPALRHRRRAGR